MSALDLLSGLGANSLGALRGFDALKELTADPAAKSGTATSALDERPRLAPSVKQIDETGLIGATRDIANGMLKAFRSELRNALDHVGISGDSAGALVRDIARSFADAVRDGANFSMTLVAAAYQETIVQAGDTVSHALEFAASALTVDYNHATGEFSADTSTLEIDAIRIVQGTASRCRTRCSISPTRRAPEASAQFSAACSSTWSKTVSRTTRRKKPKKRLRRKGT